MAKKVRIKQVRSLSGRKHDQHRTMAALGIRKLGHSVELQDTPQIRGMIRKVIHLVTVTEA